MNLGLRTSKRKRTFAEVTTVHLYKDATSDDEVDLKTAKSVVDDNDDYPGALLHDLLRQFEADKLAKPHISQQQKRIQRETTAKILKVIQKIILGMQIRSDAGYVLSKYEELKMALELLIGRWGLGDAQICSSLVETLLLSYLSIGKACDGVLMQEFILLDLLPCATDSDSDDCHHVQSTTAKALIQILSKCGDNCNLYKPIFRWCKWYLNHHHYYKPQNILGNEAALIPAVIHQLGLQLLRCVPSIELLPMALSINLEFFAVSAAYTDSTNTLLLQKHTKEFVVAMRQRWIELITTRNSKKINFDDLATSEESVFLDCQFQLFGLFEKAVLNQDTKQSRLLSEAYIQLLKETSVSAGEVLYMNSSYGLPNRDTKTKSTYDAAQSDICNAEINVLAIDWIVVMMLLSSKPYHRKAVMIVDSWRMSEACNSLSQVIDILFMNRYTRKLEEHDMAKDCQLYLPNSSLANSTRRSIQQRLIPCLLRLVSVLLLKPQRDWLLRDGMLSADIQMELQTDLSSNSLMLENRYILMLFACLDYQGQKEFINMLLHITDECLLYYGEHMSKSSRPKIKLMLGCIHEASYMQRVVCVVHRSIFTILKYIGQENLLSFHLKSKLMEHLTLPPAQCGPSSALNINVDREISFLLVSLLKRNIENGSCCGMKYGCSVSEVLMLLNKLLFGENCRGRAAFAIRGMALAKELLTRNHNSIISIKERQLIEEWVMQRLLPCTRRMVEPELGLIGLSIFDGWVDSDSFDATSTARSSLFLNIKMMVANTGLVQVSNIHRGDSSGYETTRPVVSRIILAYASANTQSTPHRDPETQREIILSLDFFMRRIGEIVANPSRWSPTADWVYMLVDKYLQMGRRRVSKGWNPLTWLRASMEMPAIDTSFLSPSNETQRLIIEFIDNKLCQFELSSVIQSHNCFPRSYADLLVSRLSSNKLKFFIDSLSYFAAALIMGISLSSAVLNNAFEHTRTRNFVSGELRAFMKSQICKIYDLRAKSTTLDSLFASIDSALRRSLIRKKRAMVFLSDDSSTDCPVLSSTQSRVENSIFASLGRFLNETRRFRRIIFTGTQYLGCELLWSFSESPSDCEMIQKSLDVLLSCKTDRELRQSFLELSKTLETKLHVIKHILRQLENSHLPQSSTKTKFQHCCNEFSFFVNWLGKLRKGSATVRCTKNERIVSFIGESLVLLVHLTSSYLQVIALFIQRTYHSAHFRQGKGIDDRLVMTFNECIGQIETFQAKNGESDGNVSTPRRLFDYFTYHLGSTAYAEVANSIFECLFAIALFDDHAMVQLFELSWAQLHNIHVHSEANDDSPLLSCPLAVSLSVAAFTRQSHTIDQKSCVKIIIGIINKLLKCSKLHHSHFLHLHIGMIRHWGILTASGEIGRPFLLRQLVSLGANLNSLLVSFDASIGEKLDRHELGKKCSRTIKSSDASLVVGLDVTTFQEFFETLLNLVVVTTATLTFGQQTNKVSTNVNQHFIECLGLFRGLMDTYKDHIIFFPNKCVVTICCASKDLLQIAARQVKACVEWQENKHLSEKQETVVIEDIGASVLKELTHCTLSNVAEPTLSLCDVWQESKVMNKSKLMSLRLSVEKTMRQIKDIPHSHSGGSFGVECDEVNERGHSNGSYTSEQICTNEEQSVFAQSDIRNVTNCEVLVKVSGKSNIDDGTMFGVMGHWGDGGNADDDTESSGSLNIENPGSFGFEHITEEHQSL